jgi:phage protein D
LFPGSKVTTSGYKPEIDATCWLIAEVTHSWADRGFTTALHLRQQ